LRSIVKSGTESNSSWVYFAGFVCAHVLKHPRLCSSWCTDLTVSLSSTRSSQDLTCPNLPPNGVMNSTMYRTFYSVTLRPVLMLVVYPSHGKPTQENCPEPIRLCKQFGRPTIQPKLPGSRQQRITMYRIFSSVTLRKSTQKNWRAYL
jgi:hypothetical protein